MAKQYLGEAIEEYAKWRAGRRLAAGTLRNEKMVLSRFARICGPILVESLGEAHVDAHWADAATTKTSGLTIDYAALRGFLGWCARTGRISRRRDLMVNIVPPLRDKKVRRRVPVRDFPRLLDSAQHPRDRAILAVALYTLLRANEITDLRIGDVRLDDGILNARISKGVRQQVKEVEIAIGLELDVELRRWLTYYTEQAGALSPAWHLVPAKSSWRWERDPNTNRFVRSVRPTDKLKPETPWKCKREEVAQRALEAIGFPIRNAAGDSLHEGMHTLRRSGARALFDALIDEGEDSALTMVQEALNHESIQMTLRYIGWSRTRARLHDRIRGKVMYPVDRDNVVEMEGRRGEKGVADGSTGGEGRALGM